MHEASYLRLSLWHLVTCVHAHTFLIHVCICAIMNTRTHTKMYRSGMSLKINSYGDLFSVWLVPSLVQSGSFPCPFSSEVSLHSHLLWLSYVLPCDQPQVQPVLQEGAVDFQSERSIRDWCFQSSLQKVPPLLVCWGQVAAGLPLAGDGLILSVVLLTRLSFDHTKVHTRPLLLNPITIPSRMLCPCSAWVSSLHPVSAPCEN